MGPSGGVTEAVAPAAADPVSARGGRLAATGTDALGMLAAGSVLALLGAALIGRRALRRGVQGRGR
ncbi:MULTISPECIES: hypothetical protein [unclassified Rathayibacter]|uniref:hypothetical protein n=1 Tax=unclassified Rathayibacter TaxID=2609250 RepID=UPI0012E866C4|nr:MULTISPECIES: hypothetical protein [unclassified Rathayibacter]